MALWFPPSVSVSGFEGGYKSKSDYVDLGIGETNDAQNVLYDPGRDLSTRPGCLKLLNVVMESPTRPITGHYYFDKSGPGATFHIVATGSKLFQYTSATASVIRTGLTDNSNAFWNFVQMQDPRSAGDDILIGTNGVDPIQVWNGSGTAVLLSAFAGAANVPVCKYLLQHNKRLYAFNIVDAADADAGVKYMRTDFNALGAATPQNFTESNYFGGSGPGGAIQGAKILGDNIFVFTRKSTWRYAPSSGGIGDIQELTRSHGVIAPRSIVECGGVIIFLSERGVYAFDGGSFVHLSEKVDDELLSYANASQLQYATAIYDEINNSYVLYFASGSSTRNDRALVYDLREGMKCWQPPITGRQVSVLSKFDDSNGLTRLCFGDYMGFLYEDQRGTNDGIATGYNGTVDAVTYGTLNDIGAGFVTATGVSAAFGGLRGLSVRITSGLGVDQERRISSNDSETLTLESNWDILPNSDSTYSVGSIDSYWKSKDYEMGHHDIVKLYRHVRLRLQEQGNFNLTLHYIVDFNTLTRATSAQIPLLESSMVWDYSKWDQSRWATSNTIRRKVSLRSTNEQSTQGTHMALRLSNNKANQSFRMSGFDIEFKEVGKK